MGFFRDFMNRIGSFAKGIVIGTLSALSKKQEHLQGLLDRLHEIDKAATGTDRRLLFATIGQTLSTWARMEEALVIVVALLLRVHTSKAGLIMYSIINFNVWLTLIHDLFVLDVKLNVRQKRWNKINERIRKIKDQRDQLAHHPVHESKSSFMSSGAAIHAPKYDTRQKTKRQYPIDSGQVIQLGETVLQIIDDLEELITAMGGTLAASDEKFESLSSGHSPQSGAQ